MRFFLAVLIALIFSNPADAQFGNCPLGCSGFGASSPAAGPPAAVYLPNVGTSPVVVYFMRRLVAAYAGPLFQVQRASDNATMDVPQLANGLPDAAAVVAWASGSPTTISIWYDQSGNGRNATQPTLALQPIYDAAGQYGQAAAYNSFVAAMFDGWVDVPSGNIRRPKQLILPAGVTYENQNHSTFLAFDPKSALYNDVYYGTTASAGGATITATGTAASLAGIYEANAPANTVSNNRARQDWQALGQLSGVSSYQFLQDGVLFTASNSKWQQTVIGGMIGDDPNGSGDFLSGDNFFGVVIYPTQLSGANAAAVTAALNGTFGFPTSFTNTVVSVGDSIQYGPSVTESLKGRTSTRTTRALLNNQPALYNMGLSAQLLTGAGGLAANSSTREYLLISASTGFIKRILDIEIGTNDIGTGAQTGAGLYIAMATYVANSRAAGATHIILHTLLPRSGSFPELNVYNALVRANTIGADAIADVAADPIMGNQANVTNPLYYQDGLHPTGYGFTIIAPIIASAINSVAP